MNCPYCGREIADHAEHCPECGYPIENSAYRTQRRQPEEIDQGLNLTNRRLDTDLWRVRIGKFLRIGMWVLLWTISLAIFAYAGYKIYYWRQTRENIRMYAEGILPTPEVEAVMLSDGRPGHVVTFFGEDGDMIYVEELQRSFLVVGGEAKAEIADSEWFKTAGSDVESAQIALTPVQTFKDGGKRLLPVLYFTVEVPVSPLNIISPVEDREVILSAEYQIEFSVVPGSTVLVDGMDVTDLVNAQGEVTVNVAVYPQGDNPISILVRTPHHRETRADIVLYREPMEIDLALAINTSKKSVLDRMTVRGTVDPGASIVVDTPHIIDSITIDEDGDFSFAATFSQIGYNTVTLRAVQEGKKDSKISFQVYYIPTLNEYSRKAWAMDYTQLTRCWDIWMGRVFKCTGTVEAVLSAEPQVIVLDVSSDQMGEYIVIENLSGVSITEPGGKFTFYADVSGWREEYMGDEYPYLIGRYASVEK